MANVVNIIISAQAAAANVAIQGVLHQFDALAEFISDSVKEATKLESALVGLSSVAAFKGLAGSEAQDAVRNLTAVKSGLISVGEASTAAKNLLQANFNLTQTVDILERMSDSAAFARQGSLSFGRAVVSATEGIRNQNSILSDNAGLTKNLSVILEERGFKLKDLNDKVKGLAAREALYQGILVETAAQQGDAARYAELYAGQVSKLDAAYDRLKATIGSYVTQSSGVAGLIGVTTDAINDLNRALGRTPSNAPVFDFINQQLLKTAAGATALKLTIKGAHFGTEGEGYKADIKTLDELYHALGVEDRGFGRGKAQSASTLIKELGFERLYRYGLQTAAGVQAAFTPEGQRALTEKQLKAAQKAREDERKLQERFQQDSRREAHELALARVKDDPLATIRENALQEQRDLYDKFKDAEGRFRGGAQYDSAKASILAKANLEYSRESVKVADAAYGALDSLRATYATATGNPLVQIAVTGATEIAKLRKEIQGLPADMKAVGEASIATQQALTGLSLAGAAGTILREISDAGAELRALTEPTYAYDVVRSANGGIPGVRVSETYARETEQQKIDRLFGDAAAVEAVYKAAFEQADVGSDVAAREARRLANQGLVSEARGFDINAFTPSQRAQYAQERVEYRKGQAEMLARAIATDENIKTIAVALTAGNIPKAAAALAVDPADMKKAVIQSGQEKFASMDVYTDAAGRISPSLAGPAGQRAGTIELIGAAGGIVAGGGEI